MRPLIAMVLAVTVTAVLGLITAPAAAASWRGPCISGTSGPTCSFWKGKATFVADGDTVAVDVYGDGTSTPIRVRLTGINAMEQSVYSTNPANRRGACHALEATARLEQLIKQSRRVVRLAAQSPRSRAGARYRRFVAVRVNGAWRDTGQILLQEGHALWLPNGREWARNSRYSRAVQEAAAAGLRLWDRDYCGVGPQDENPLRMWVNWNADGTDTQNVNGEWIKVKNTGAVDLPIGGWWVRDSFLARYTFPAHTVIPAGGKITLFVGRRPAGDPNTTTHFYWNRGSAVFENVTPRTGIGDGGYLFDPHGDLRAWMIYPCAHECSDPLQGNVAVSAKRAAPEEVYVRNVGASTLDLEGYVAENPPYVYSVGADTVLAPGETMRLVVIGSPESDTRLVKHWAKDRYILNDGGDFVVLRTATDIRIDCYAWGSVRC